jgi:peptidyl-prolyl cis-trans isomerase D
MFARTSKPSGSRHAAVTDRRAGFRMLDTIANKFQTTVLVVLVFMLIAVFVLQFGNQQAEGFSSGGTEVAASVRGHDVTAGDFRAIYMLVGFDRMAEERQRIEHARETVMNGIVDRILLADEAEKLGLVVEPDEAMQKLVTDDTVMVTLGQDASPFLPQGELQLGLRDENGEFDREMAQMFVRNRLRRSMGEFAEWQAQERMAERMRDTIRANVAVSDQEVWEAYVAEQDKAQIEYVQFRSAYFRNTLEPTEAALTAWMAEHESEIDQDYEQNRHRYTGLPEQVRARHILIRSSQSGAEADRAAARARAEAILARVRGGEDFATLARSMSEDASSGPRGGDLGYVRRGQRPDAFEDALFALEDGQVSDVIETAQGFHVLRAEGRREGDVPEAEAKREIAERLYREAQAGEAAQAAAGEALAFLGGGGTMEQLRERLPGYAGAEGEHQDPLAPRVTETQLFGRGENPIRGGVDNGPLLEAAFELTEEHPVAEAPIRLGSDYYVVRLKQRQRPTEEGFDDATRRRLRTAILTAKQQEAVAEYTRALRDRAEAEGEVLVRRSLLSYGDEQAPEEPEQTSSSPNASGEG